MMIGAQTWSRGAALVCRNHFTSFTSAAASSFRSRFSHSFPHPKQQRFCYMAAWASASRLPPKDDAIKLVSFLAESGDISVGIVRGDSLWSLHEVVKPYLQSQVGDMETVIRHWDNLKDNLALEGSSRKVSEFRLLSPIPRPTGVIMCIGKNYLDHVKEVDTWKQNPGITQPEAPKYPIVFTKTPQSVIGPGEAIEYPHGVSTAVDYEAELGVIIGKPGKNIKREDAMSYVFGYTIINDVTARDLQKRHQQWFLGKSCDTFCPMGPAIVPASELDGNDLQIQLWVNDELRQNGRSSKMIFGIPQLIEVISASITIQPGDIIATGTPSGVGSGFDPPKYLVPGDRIRIQIEGIGELCNTVEEDLLKERKTLTSSQFVDVSSDVETKLAVMYLPEDLVVKIIARMPFPEIFKARALSKEWRTRFSPIEFQDDIVQNATRSQAKKSLVVSGLASLQKEVGAADFQRQVVEWSSDWESFSHVRLGPQDSWAYDLACHNWRRIPPLSFLPNTVGTDYSVTKIEGALLLLCQFRNSDEEKFYIANILTQSWKELPLRPNATSSFFYEFHVVNQMSTQTYKVVVLSEEFMHRGESSLQVYDSKSNAWSSKKLAESIEQTEFFAHLDGILYMLLDYNRLLAFDVEVGAFEEITLSGEVDLTDPCYLQLVVSKASLLMIVTRGHIPSPTYQVVQIDLKLQTLLEIAHGPPSHLKLDICYTATTSHGDYLYFGFKNTSKRVLAYNLLKDEWTCFPFHFNPDAVSSDCYFDIGEKHSSFQPGLKPFMAV